MEQKLPDEAITPIMDKFKVSKEEATKRLMLLFESGIMDCGDPDSDETKMLVDDFLAQDSETLAGAVRYEKALNECLSNTELVKQYDRLNGTKLTQAMRKVNAGYKPKNFEKLIEDFEKFCQEFIFSRIVN